ncbi:Uncharacterized [Syntrophomonas zehnderi OL-4]|uniref:Uncharacterized n=1 Tax=Syntrophomonas zehnderi OL-4 TaxID=690567 RepID=A0A0E4GBU2_9FIRM|nr:DUF2953 domain-containing protein [Syntrophomonas zehnderi]CFX94116.1 Uncharacterized [Syntrophomonas zehnderi OL-4]
MCYIVAILLGCLVSLSFFYGHGRITIEIFEQDHVQGIKLDIKIPFYQKKGEYDFSDPRLHLWEALLVDRMNSKPAGQSGFNGAALKNVLRKISALYHTSPLEKMRFDIIQKTLSYLVVDNLEWKTTTGGNDAMQAALRSGCFWALQSWVAVFISLHCRLNHLQLAVKPDFANNIFLSNFACILKMRIVHIIIIVFYILAWKVRWWINGITTDSAEQPSH